MDGNKRTAYVVCRTFLKLNGLDLDTTQEEKYLTFLQLAEGLLSEEELAVWIGSRLTSNGIEERQLSHKLVECVSTSLERLSVDEKTRGYLVVLWQFLRVQASEDAELEAVSRLDRALVAEIEISGEKRPSLRKLAEQLRIPRERLPALYRTLGDLLERCRAANS